MGNFIDEKVVEQEVGVDFVKVAESAIDVERALRDDHYAA